MNKVSEVLKAIKFVKLEEFYSSLQITKQLFGQQVKACEAGEILNPEYYKKAQIELTRIYNLIVDTIEAETLDENDEPFASVFKMNLLIKAKESGHLESYLEQIDEILKHLAKRLLEAKTRPTGPRKKVAPDAANELKTAKLKPSDDPEFDDRVKKFLAKPIR